MRPRGGRGTAPLELRALYSVAMLARIANISRQMLHRLLRSSRVSLVRVGRSVSVPLSEIRWKIPALWTSICEIESIRNPVEKRRRGRPSRLSRPRNSQG
jgi:hypothetical protein